MKKKILGIILVPVLMLSFSLVTAVPAVAANPTTIASSTMVFQSVVGYTLVYDSGTGTYSGMIPMAQDESTFGDGVAGFDLYAQEDATYYVNTNSLEVGTIFEHDWTTWDPDTPDWDGYSLRFYEEGGVQKWRVANHSGTSGTPWYLGGGSGPVEQGVPMSGIMDWTGMYAVEIDTGEYLPPIDPDTHPKHPHWAATYGGGPACWDMDWSWGSEVVPLQYPGFSVEIVHLSGDQYTVTLTPAPVEVSEVWVDDDWDGATIGEEVEEGKFFGYNAFSTIQDGINGVSGSTVYVAAGTYTETGVSLPYHSISLIGAGKDVVIWDGAGGRCIDWLGPSASVPVITPLSYEITGFTFQSNMPDGGDGMIKLCKANRNQDIGFSFDFYDNRIITTGNSNYGLWLCRNSGIVRDGVTGESAVKIYNNIFQTTSGICMSNSDNYDIFNNDFTYDVVGNGYATKKNAAIYIGSGCTTEQPSRGGHHIWGNSFAHVGDGYDGSESTYPRGAIVIDHYSGQTGLTLLANIIESNTFNNPNGCGISAYSDDNVVYPIDYLRWNYFNGNLYGVYVDGPYASQRVIDAIANWWGDISGPLHETQWTYGSETIGPNAGSGDQVTDQVLYEPWIGQGGMITGGGWIYSPAGAYTANPELEGKATFGFVSRYKKGAAVPTGNTHFIFHVADLNFYSSSYDWLVITGGQKAMYKGSGTINDTGDYGFILSAIDGDPDMFRIKIWDKANDSIIYDNQVDGPDGTEIGGGQIIIHKK